MRSLRPGWARSAWPARRHTSWSEAGCVITIITSISPPLCYICGRNMYQSRHFEAGRRWSGTRFRIYNVQQPSAGVRCQRAQIDQAHGQATAGTGTRPMMPEADSEVAHRVKVLRLVWGRRWRTPAGVYLLRRCHLFRNSNAFVGFLDFDTSCRDSGLRPPHLRTALE